MVFDKPSGENPFGPAKVYPPDSHYPIVVRQLLDIALGHTPLDAKPWKNRGTDLSSRLPLRRMRSRLEELEQYKRDPERLEISPFQTALVNFAKRRLEFLEYRDQVFISRMTGSPVDEALREKRAESLAMRDSEGRSLLLQVMTRLPRHPDEESLRRLGVTAEHLQRLAAEVPAPLAENVLPSSMDSFPVHLLPHRDYPEWVRFVMASCFADDEEQQPLRDYGVDVDQLADGKIQNHALRQLRETRYVDSRFMQTHDSILAYAERRMYRIFLQLHRLHTSRQDEYAHLTLKILQSRQPEADALQRLQMQLREFADRYGARKLGSLGFVPAILSALDLDDLADTEANGTSTSAREAGIETSTDMPAARQTLSLPSSDYPKLVQRLLSSVLLHVPLGERSQDRDYSMQDLESLGKAFDLHDALASITIEDGSPLLQFHDTLFRFLSARLGKLAYEDFTFIGEVDPSEADPEELVRDDKEAIGAFRTAIGQLEHDFGIEALVDVGLMPGHLSLLGLPELAEKRQRVQSDREPGPATNGDHEKISPLIFPVPNYPVLVRTAFAYCLYYDFAELLDDYGIDKEILDDSNWLMAETNLMTLSGLTNVPPTLIGLHTTMVQYLRDRMERIGIEALQLTRGFQLSREEYQELQSRSQEASGSEAVALGQLQANVRQFVARYGSESLRQLGLEHSVLKALGLEDVAASHGNYSGADQVASSEEPADADGPSTTETTTPSWSKEDLKRFRSRSASVRWRQPEWEENRTGLLFVNDEIKDDIQAGDYVIVGSQWRKVEHLLTDVPQMAMVVALRGEPVDRARLASIDPEIYVTVDDNDSYDPAQLYLDIALRMLGIAGMQPGAGNRNPVVDAAKLALIGLMKREVESWNLHGWNAFEASALYDCLKEVDSQIRHGYPEGSFDRVKRVIEKLGQVHERY